MAAGSLGPLGSIPGAVAGGDLGAAGSEWMLGGYEEAWHDDAGLVGGGTAGEGGLLAQMMAIADDLAAALPHGAAVSSLNHEE